MRILWRATAFLFWQYPILWLPVVIADFTAYCLRLLQGWTRDAVINDLLARHSVLSNQPEPLQKVPLTWITFIGVSKIATELLNTCLYVSALVAISIFIPTMLAQARVPWQQALAAINLLRVKILLLAIKILGMLMIAEFLDIAMWTYLPRLHFLHMPSALHDVPNPNLALIALLCAAAAWLMAPSALAMLRPPESAPTEAIGIRYARAVAGLCVLASVAAYYLTTVLRPSFNPLLTTKLTANAFWAIASVVSALPYIPLFIALHLIAHPANPLSEASFNLAQMEMIDPLG